MRNYSCRAADTLGRGASADRRGRGRRLTAWGGKFIPPHVADIEFGKAGEVEDITKMVKGIAS